MRQHFKGILCGLLVVCLLGSIGFNIYLVTKAPQEDSNEIWNINFPDANSRDTYFSIHNLEAAQALGKGEGIKVGILDWGFGFAEHEDLYAGGRDFTTFEYHDENFLHANEHGFWMAQTLKEIAPGAEVYALGTFTPDDETKWVDAMIEAIGWAVENKLDILTLSHQKISDKNRDRFDEAVNNAIEKGIVTTFIHYDNPNNILPWGIWEDSGEYGRLPDINIFQYDYNTVFLQNYAETVENKDFDSAYKSNLFLSVSSMSPVTAGFVAILKSINPTLTPAQYKEILVQTSRPGEYENEKADHVVDIAAAVQYLKENY